MKKVTILLGAGAAIPWGAPSTKMITQALRECPDHFVGDITFGEWSHQFLSRVHHNAEPNFEHYIDLIESIYTYLNDELQSKENGIFKIDPLVVKSIEQLRFKNDSQFISNYHKIVATFYSSLRIIQNKVNPYLNNFLDNSQSLNQKMKFFIEHFIKIGYSVRSYSLNYDRCIPQVFESYNSKYEIFDGFDIQEHEAEDLDLYFCNKSRILDDNECNSFYNLHGSFNWTFQDCDYKTTNSKFPFVLMSSKKYRYVPAAQIDEYLIDSNPNERLLQTQIITGFKKIQRINLEPFNYFFNTFFCDIHQSEIIIVIGYSYSDPHINQLLRDALRRRVRLYNINFRPAEKQYKSISNQWGQILRNDYSEYSRWYKDIEFFYWDYIDGFEEFLKTEEWFWIQPI